MAGSGNFHRNFVPPFTGLIKYILYTYAVCYTHGLALHWRGELICTIYIETSVCVYLERPVVGFSISLPLCQLSLNDMFYTLSIYTILDIVEHFPVVNIQS